MYYTEEFVAYKFTYLLLIVFKSIMLKCNPVIIQTWWLVRHSEKSNVSDICLISVRIFLTQQTNPSSLKSIQLMVYL